MDKTLSIIKTRPILTQSPVLRSQRITTTGKLKFAPLVELQTAKSRISYRLNCVSSSDVSSLSSSSSDVILLDVRGMTCGGCSSSVKRILENQPQVSSADVNLTTATAIVCPISEAKVAPNWKQVIGEELAKSLTNCGFDSNFRGETATEEGSS